MSSSVTLLLSWVWSQLEAKYVESHALFLHIKMSSSIKLGKLRYDMYGVEATISQQCYSFQHLIAVHFSPSINSIPLMATKMNNLYVTTCSAQINI